MFGYYDKSLIVTLLPFPNSVTMSNHHCTDLPNGRDFVFGTREQKEFAENGWKLRDRCSSRKSGSGKKKVNE